MIDGNPSIHFVYRRLFLSSRTSSRCDSFHSYGLLEEENGYIIHIWFSLGNKISNLRPPANQYKVLVTRLILVVEWSLYADNNRVIKVMKLIFIQVLQQIP